MAGPRRNSKSISYRWTTGLAHPPFSMKNWSAPSSPLVKQPNEIPILLVLDQGLIWSDHCFPCFFQSKATTKHQFRRWQVPSADLRRQLQVCRKWLCQAEETERLQTEKQRCPPAGEQTTSRPNGECRTDGRKRRKLEWPSTVAFTLHLQMALFASWLTNTQTTSAGVDVSPAPRVFSCGKKSLKDVVEVWSRPNYFMKKIILFWVGC